MTEAKISVNTTAAPAALSATGNQSHSHNLSINSISSIAEPTTPPTATTGSKLYLWDSAKMNGTLALPTFNLDSQKAPETTHIRQYSLESDPLETENQRARAYPLNPAIVIAPPVKIDKEYLASINKTPLSQLKDQIFRLAKDQHGCRFLQKRIDENVVSNSQTREANFEVIFEQVHPILYELIIDPFGNYLIQKLIDYCDETNLNLILETLQFNLFLISINQHGTRALQKVIDRMSSDYQLSLLIKGLKPYIIELIKDLNGNHVIQKILNKYSPENCQFIYDSIIQDLLVVATHKHGCCVLQKCLNHVNPSQLMQFSTNILKYNVFMKLVNDQFGNYVLQYLISIDSIEVNGQLYSNFVRFGVSDLCKLKFSSNVVEKLMRNCFNNEFKSVEFSNLKFSLVSQILSSDLNKLINDPYGNYVIQTLIDTLINPSITYLFDLPGGGRILLPSLQMLVAEDYQNQMDSLQIQIIKRWFRNCKIVSSFGRRIQLKINIILSGYSKVQRKSYPSQNGSSMPFMPPVSNQSMNANGEFIHTAGFTGLKQISNRSMSLEPLQLNPYLGYKHLYANSHGQEAFARQAQNGSVQDFGMNQLSFGGYSLAPHNSNNGAFRSAPRNLPSNAEIPEFRNLEYNIPNNMHNPKHSIAFNPCAVSYANSNEAMFDYKPHQNAGNSGSVDNSYVTQPGSNGLHHYAPGRPPIDNSAKLVQQNVLAFNAQPQAGKFGQDFQFGNSNYYNQTHPNIPFNSMGGKGRFSG